MALHLTQRSVDFKSSLDIVIFDTGGFNDDWDLTYIGALSAAYDKPKIRQSVQYPYAGDLCKRLYGFSAQFYMRRGYVYHDRCLLDNNEVLAWINE